MSKKSKSQQQVNEPTKSVIQEAPLILSKRYITNEDLQKLENLTPYKIENYLAQLLNLNDYETELRMACILDYYTTQYWWAAKIKQFNKDQIGTYFSIAYLLMESLKEKQSRIHENIEDLKGMLIELNDKFKLFSEDQIKEIISHLSLTFFQNQKIFAFVISEPQPEVFMTREIDVECPRPPTETMYPPPLDEAIPEPYYNKYILKVPEGPSDEELARQEAEQMESIQLTQEVIEEIRSRFSDLSLEEAKRIIFEVTNDLVSGLKADMRSKIKDREAALINELSKTQKKSVKK